MVGPLELFHARNQPSRVREGDERSLKTRAPQEPHGCGVELRGIGARDQDEQPSGLVQIDMAQVGGCCASREQITARDCAPEPRERGSLGGRERMFAEGRPMRDYARCGQTAALPRVVADAASAATREALSSRIAMPIPISRLMRTRARLHNARLSGAVGLEDATSAQVSA